MSGGGKEYHYPQVALLRCSLVPRLSPLRRGEPGKSLGTRLYKMYICHNYSEYVVIISIPRLLGGGACSGMIN